MKQFLPALIIIFSCFTVNPQIDKGNVLVGGR